LLPSNSGEKVGEQTLKEVRDGPFLEHIIMYCGLYPAEVWRADIVLIAVRERDRRAFEGTFF